jgi:hypothetical protein
LVREREASLEETLLDALKKWDRPSAKSTFEVLQEWNKLNEFLTVTKDSLSTVDRVTYVCDSYIFRNLVRLLTRTADEAVSYVSGYDLGERNGPRISDSDLS